MSAGPRLPDLGRIRLPWRRPPFVAATVLAALALALGAGRLSFSGSPAAAALPPEVEAAALRAELAMRRAEAFLRVEKERAGLRTDPLLDPGRTGLIGDELTPLTTTLGNLAAKRTAADPRWAGELVRRLWRAGIRAGSPVAAGFSGSFPGLNLAVTLACRELGADLGVISSVTASTYGANQPGFTWPEMEARLARVGFLAPVSLAVTAGGDNDRATDLLPEGRQLAASLARRSARSLGAAYLRPPDFQASVTQRLAVYRRWAGGRRIAVYVNVGGTEASLGRSEAVLRLRSGFLPPAPFDFSPDRGVLARMAEAGVPVLTLLNVRDLALRWGVPLDG